MTNSTSVKKILWLSLPLSLLLVFTSAVGIFIPGFYSAETLNWQAQSFGQDVIDLFLVFPCLIITSLLAMRNNKVAWMLWGGVLFYLTYTFVIFCFDVHFNRLFFLYCVELGLSFYGSLLFLFECRKQGMMESKEGNNTFKLTGIYFIVIASAFYFLWLTEIIPSLFNNTTPSVLSEAGLFTNPVHVLDLAVVLPGIFITGILVLRKNKFGLLLAPAILMFFILMDLTICYLVMLMYERGLASSQAAAYGMLLIGAFSIILLNLFLRRYRNIKV